MSRVERRLDKMYSDYWLSVHEIVENRESDIMSFKPLLDFKLKCVGMKYYGSGAFWINENNNGSKKKEKNVEDLFCNMFLNRKGPTLYHTFYNYITTYNPCPLTTMHFQLFWQQRYPKFHNIKMLQNVKKKTKRYVLFC